MLAIFLNLFTMTRMVIIAFNIKGIFFYTNKKLFGTIETCFGTFYVFKSGKAKLMVLYVLMIIYNLDKPFTKTIMVNLLIHVCNPFFRYL
jgi:hypothetical protein